VATSGLDDQITKFWELGNVSKGTTYSTEEKMRIEHFKMVQTVQRNKESRFVVRLPLHENSNTLVTLRSMAWKRFLSLENRLSSNPELKKKIR